jgi:hypothetical protein
LDNYNNQRDIGEGADLRDIVTLLRPPHVRPASLGLGEHHKRLRLPKPMPDGPITLYLTPLELLDRLAQLIPPPHRHRHRYYGPPPMDHCEHR